MRITPLARRLGTAALVLTIGVGVTSCSSDDSSASDSPSSATDAGSDASETPSEEPSETTAALAELSGADFYPSVMAAMKEAETFNFSTTSGASGQTQEMTGQARF